MAPPQPGDAPDPRPRGPLPGPAAPGAPPDRARAGLARGYATGVAAAAVLASTAVLIRYLALEYHLPALVMAFWRDVFVVAILVPVLAAARRDLLRLPAGMFPLLALLGLVLALFHVLWTLSITLNGAAVAIVLVFCSTAFTVVLGRWFLGEPLGLAKFLAAALCLGGCVLVSDAYQGQAWRGNLMGILTGVLSALAYSVFNLLGRTVARRGVHPWTTLVYIFSFASVFLLPANLLPGGPLPGSAARAADLFWLGRSAAGWTVLVLLSIGPTLVGFALFLETLRHLPSSVAGQVDSLEPAFTAAYAYLFLGERLGPAQIGGSLLILGAVALLHLQDTRRLAGAG